MISDRKILWIIDFYANTFNICVRDQNLRRCHVSFNYVKMIMVIDYQLTSKDERFCQDRIDPGKESKCSHINLLYAS